MTRAGDWRRWLVPAALCAAGVLVLVATSDPGGAEWRQYFGRWRSRHVLSALACFAAAGYALAALRSTRTLAIALFATLLAGFTWGLLELPGLLGVVSYPSLLGNRELIPTNELAAAASPHQDVSGETWFDTALGWGIAHDRVPFHYRTDQHGFRNPIDADAADLYVLGDSIVVGALVAQERTVTAQLAALTGRSVMSVALIGISPAEEQRLFEAAGLPADGRLVLQFVFEGNDLPDTRTDRQARAAAGRGQAAAEPSMLDRSFARNLGLAIMRWTQPEVSLAARRSCRVGGQRILFNWTAASHRGFVAEEAQLLDDLSQFAERIRTAGGRYVVVLVPTKLRVYGPACEWPEESELDGPDQLGPLPALLGGWSERTGVPFVDLTPALQEALAQGRPPWFWGDTHWNESGHEAAARALAAAQPLREWLAERARR